MVLLGGQRFGVDVLKHDFRRVVQVDPGSLWRRRLTRNTSPCHRIRRLPHVTVARLDRVVGEVVGAVVFFVSHRHFAHEPMEHAAPVGLVGVVGHLKKSQRQKSLIVQCSFR